MPKNCVWFAEVNRKDLGLVGGKGGGRPELAEAGGKDLSRIGEIRESARLITQRSS